MMEIWAHELDLTGLPQEGLDRIAAQVIITETIRPVQFETLLLDRQARNVEQPSSSLSRPV